MSLKSVPAGHLNGDYGIQVGTFSEITRNESGDENTSGAHPFVGLEYP